MVQTRFTGRVPLLRLLGVVGAFLLVACSSWAFFSRPVTVNLAMDGTFEEGSGKWGFYHPHGKAKFSVLSSEGHHGMRAGRLRISDFDHTNGLVSVGLLAAPTDGYTGEAAPQLKPETNYAIRFFAKGSMSSVVVRLLTWTDETGTVAARRYVDTELTDVGRSKRWRRYETIVRTEGTTKRGALMFYTLRERVSVQSVEEFYLDDVVFQECLESPFDRYRQTMNSARATVLHGLEGLIP
jgi:hypothetical protein